MTRRHYNETHAAATRFYHTPPHQVPVLALEPPHLQTAGADYIAESTGTSSIAVVALATEDLERETRRAKSYDFSLFLDRGMLWHSAPRRLPLLRHIGHSVEKLDRLVASCHMEKASGLLDLINREFHWRRDAW